MESIRYRRDNPVEDELAWAKSPTPYPIAIANKLFFLATRTAKN